MNRFRFGASVLVLLVLVLASASTARSQNRSQDPLTRILFIYDASNSMLGQWQSGVKNKVAQKLLSQALDSLEGTPNLQLALRVYGHTKFYKQDYDCEDTELVVPFSARNNDRIKSKLYEIRPKGTTLIAYSLEQAANDFPPCKNCRNIIILITDGIEECNGDPCAVSMALQRKGIVLKPFVIGVGLDVAFKKTFECIGNYYDASNEETFQNVLGIVISQALNSTSAQVNLLDIAGNPTETNVNMTFYNQHTGGAVYNYVHTMNAYGNPDTLKIDPVLNYRLVVHTIPQVVKDSIELTAGTHNIIGVDAPQGSLHLKLAGLGNYNKLKAIVRRNGEMETLHLQDLNTIDRYLVGIYDLEILTLPRIFVEDVDIRQSHTTTMEIPQPGVCSVSRDSDGFGSLYVEKNNQLVWLCNLMEDSKRETLTLQPGKYKIVFRPKGAREAIFTIEKNFRISSGSSVAIKL